MSAITPEMIDLARRAVACTGWQWLEGMRTTDGWIVVSVEAVKENVFRHVFLDPSDYTTPAPCGEEADDG